MIEREIAAMFVSSVAIKSLNFCNYNSILNTGVI